MLIDLEPFYFSRFRDDNIILESGIRNASKIFKLYKKAILLYHKDLDGVVSAIIFREYLKRYGINSIKFYPINYGDIATDYFKTAGDDVLKAIVDFAYGLPRFDILLDHHIGQMLTSLDKSINIKHDPSNAEYLNFTISPKEIWKADEIEYISDIDSARYTKYISDSGDIDEVLRLIFFSSKKLIYKYYKERDKKWKLALALYCNLMILSGKNKEEFINYIVENSSPSLISLATTINNAIKKGLLVKWGKTLTVDDVYKSFIDFVEKNKEILLKGPTITLYSTKDWYPEFKSAVKSAIYDKKRPVFIYFTDIKLAVQIGMIDVKKTGGYNRYHSFLPNKDTDYLVYLYYPLPLIQISYNPFKKSENRLTNINLVENLSRIMSEFKLGDKYFQLSNLSYIQSGKSIYEFVRMFFEDAGLKIYKILDGNFLLNNLDLYVLEDGSYRPITKDEFNQVQMCLKKGEQEGNNESSGDLVEERCFDNVYISHKDYIFKFSGGHEKIYNISFIFNRKLDVITLMNYLISRLVSVIKKELKK